MSIESQPTESPEQVLDRLQMLLQAQMDKVRKNDYRSLEGALRKTGSAMTEIRDNQCFRQPQYQQRLSEVSKLYRQLNLAVAGDKKNVQKQLQKIGKGKKTVRAYRHKT